MDIVDVICILKKVFDIYVVWCGINCDDFWYFVKM